MNDSEFNQKARATLLAIEEAVESSGAEIDFEMNGEVLTLEFANGSQIVINRQVATHEIWVAAKSGGFHYRHEPALDRWVNTAGGGELFAELSRLASLQSGAAVTLA